MKQKTADALASGVFVVLSGMFICTLQKCGAMIREEEKASREFGKELSLYSTAITKSEKYTHARNILAIYKELNSLDKFFYREEYQDVEDFANEYYVKAQFNKEEEE